MRRWIILSVLALAAGASVFAAVAAASSLGGDEPSRTLNRGGLGAGYFAVACGFSHRNADDMIVFPGRRGLSHNHTYFGNRDTNFASTAVSLRTAGRTTCRLRADTAAYWAPTLYVGGKAIEPLGAVVYYIRRTFDEVDAFPARLRMIAGSATAPRAQGQNITYWSCGGRAGVDRSSTVPTCAGSSVRSGLRLTIKFPNCWDGQRLDSANHKNHMAYSEDGSCPTSHPEEVPALVIVIYYGVTGGPSTELASLGQFSAHADFVNAWDQNTLEALVDRYLNRSGRRGGGFRP
jgi:Domain of unknown function (DUF1996)